MAAAVIAAAGGPQYKEEERERGGRFSNTSNATANADAADAPPTIVTHEHDEQHQHGGGGFDVRVCMFLTLHHPAFSPLANVLAAAMGATILVSCFGFSLGTMDRFQCVKRVVLWPLVVVPDRMQLNPSPHRLITPSPQSITHALHPPHPTAGTTPPPAPSPPASRAPPPPATTSSASPSPSRHYKLSRT